METRRTSLMKFARMTLLMVNLISIGTPGRFAAQAQEAVLPEYHAKALFLYNFAKFVDYPPAAFASTNSPFVIGVYGDNPFDDHLEKAVLNKNVGGRPIQVRVFKDPESLKNCHIAFIGVRDRRQIEAAFETVRGLPVLTVGDSRAFAQAGGMINFYHVESRSDDNRLRFEINDASARAAGLKISSKLLSLGRPAKSESTR